MRAFRSPDWEQVLVPDLALAESFLRGSAVYLSLLVLFRVVLKRQGGAIGLPDVMLVVLVSECVSASLSADAKSVPNGLAAVCALLFWNYALDRLAYRWPWLRRRLEPQPVQVVRDGAPVRENLAAEEISDDELAAQLRLNGTDDLAEVKCAFVEAGGAVSVVLKDEKAAPPDEREDERAVRELLAAADRVRAVLARRAGQGPPAE